MSIKLWYYKANHSFPSKKRFLKSVFYNRHDELKRVLNCKTIQSSLTTKNKCIRTCFQTFIHLQLHDYEL